MPNSTVTTIDLRHTSPFYGTGFIVRFLRFQARSRSTTRTRALLRLRHQLHRNKPCTSHSYLNFQNSTWFFALSRSRPARYFLEVRRLSFRYLLSD